MKKFKMALILSFIISILGANNVFASQWIADRFGWLYENDTGICISNCWKKIDNYWYHFDENGYMQIGWFNDNGKWYYLSNNGIMLSDSITPDGYYVDSNGVWNAYDTYRLSSEKSPIYSYLPLLEENNGYYKNISLNGTRWYGDSWTYNISDKGDYFEIDGSAFSPEYLSAFLSHDDEALSSLRESEKYIYTGPICIKKNAIFKTMMTELKDNWINYQDYDWTNEGYTHLTSMSAEEFLHLYSSSYLGFCKMKFDENGYVVEVIDLYDV